MLTLETKPVYLTDEKSFEKRQGEYCQIKTLQRT